jgi:hypothetical protein
MLGLMHLQQIYCAFGCVLGGAVLDGAALGIALAFAFLNARFSVLRTVSRFAGVANGTFVIFGT